ncbi:MAG TPA: hypothetical protein VGM30_01545 [Puia sp.]|jgi:hypothetical protein
MDAIEIGSADPIVNNQDQALCHLFFHCCLEDEKFSDAEMNDLSGKIVALGLQPRVNIREELVRYRQYRSTITDEQAYLKRLIQEINPVNELALYSYCVELCLDDPMLDSREETLLDRIRGELGIDPAAGDTVNRLVAQRKAVEIQKIF